MTREQIEKAAKGKAEELRMSANSVRTNIDVQNIFQIGFMDGVQWRINSVWHKPSAYGKELARNVEVIAETKRGYRFGKFDVVGCLHEYIAFVSTSRLEYALSDVLEYAYLEDLLPERKEETNGGR